MRLSKVILKNWQGYYGPEHKFEFGDDGVAVQLSMERIAMVKRHLGSNRICIVRECKEAKTEE